MADSPICQAVSSSSSYGPVVPLPLLLTPPRGDAISVGYRPESVYLGRTFTSLYTRALRRTIRRHSREQSQMSQSWVD